MERKKERCLQCFHSHIMVLLRFQVVPSLYLILNWALQELQRLSTSIVFFLNGLGQASWHPSPPRASLWVPTWVG